MIGYNTSSSAVLLNATKHVRFMTTRQ